MAGPLPHSHQIQQMAECFLDDAIKEIEIARKTLKTSKGYRNIYRISLATDAVVSKLLRLRRRPPPQALRAIISKIPMLVCARQVGAARIELRRFIEMVTWSVYFEDHTVEWERFIADSSRGFVRDMDDPIEFCAHREVGFYLNYAASRLKTEPSNLAHRSVSGLRLLQTSLNAVVHPGLAAHSTTNSVPVDAIDEISLADFQKVQRSVFSNSCILLASVNRLQFNSLPAMYRAHFDWLVGSIVEKQIRAGPFGL